jgi:hypothetical protein
MFDEGGEGADYLRTSNVIVGNGVGQFDFGGRQEKLE